MANVYTNPLFNLGLVTLMYLKTQDSSSKLFCINNNNYFLSRLKDPHLEKCFASPEYPMQFTCTYSLGEGGWGTLNSGLYGEASPERGAFLSSQYTKG